MTAGFECLCIHPSSLVFRLLAGVQGDQRTHSHVVALRAVTSSDGMTADWYPFQPDFLRYVSTKICNTGGWLGNTGGFHIILLITEYACLG
jgi:hypothetical protein